MENLEHVKGNIKEILVWMALNDTLPMDMTELDVDHLFDVAVAAIKTDQYLDTSEVPATHQLLEILQTEDTGGMVDYVDEVQMAETFEFTFTIKTFLEHIGL